MRAVVVAVLAVVVGGCTGGGGGGGGGGSVLPFERGDLSADGAPRCDFEQWCVGQIIVGVPQADGMTTCVVPFGDPSIPEEYGGACVTDEVAAAWAADPCGQQTLPSLWSIMRGPSEVSAQGAPFGDPDWKVSCYPQAPWAHEIVIKGQGIDRFDEEGKLVPELSTPR